MKRIVAGLMAVIFAAPFRPSTNVDSNSMQYQAPRTGSVSRSVKSRLGDDVSVKDFGGATADVQIAAAIASLGANGGTVDGRMLSGAQTISATITITTPITLLLPRQGEATFTSTANPAIAVSGAAGVRIYGGSLLLSGLNASAVQLVGTVTDLEVEGMTVAGSGVVSDGHQGFWNNSGQTLSNIRYLNNTVSAVTVGMSINADQGGSISGGLIYGNHLFNIVGTGVGQGYAIHHANGSGNPSYLRIAANYVETAQRHAIYQARGRGVVIEANTIKDHRSTVVGPGGLERSAIVIARSADITVVGNVIINCTGGAIEVDVDTTTPTVLSRNVVISSNVIQQPRDFYPVTIGSPNPAVDGVSTDITFIGNKIFADSSVDDTYGGSLVQIYSGKRVNVIGNYLTLLNAPATRSLIQIRGVGETAGTATYTDELMFRDNYLYGTVGAGNAVAFEWFNTAATSGIRADYSFNRLNVTTPFLFDLAQTDANISVVGQSFTGASAALLSAVSAGSLQILGGGAGRSSFVDPANSGDSRIVVDTRTGTPASVLADDSVVEYRRGGSRKWAAGLNYSGLNTDTFDFFSTGNVFSLTQTGLNNNVLGFKHLRGVVGCATAATLNATCTTTVTWTTAFADANYTATCFGAGAITGTPVLQGYTSKLAASVTVQVINLTAAASSFATIECIAVHD